MSLTADSGAQAPSAPCTVEGIDVCAPPPRHTDTPMKCRNGSYCPAPDPQPTSCGENRLLAEYEPPTEINELEKIVVKFCEHGLNKNKVFPSTAEDISSNLRPLHLASGVRSERLFERKGVHADGDYIPSPCYLRKAYDGKPE